MMLLATMMLLERGQAYGYEKKPMVSLTEMDTI